MARKANTYRGARRAEARKLHALSLLTGSFAQTFVDEPGLRFPTPTAWYRPTRSTSGSRVGPHNGKREMARRVRQMEGRAHG